MYPNIRIIKSIIFLIIERKFLIIYGINFKYNVNSKITFLKIKNIYFTLFINEVNNHPTIPKIFNKNFNNGISSFINVNIISNNDDNIL